jgi:hypothetical protein
MHMQVRATWGWRWPAAAEEIEYSPMTPMAVRMVSGETMIAAFKKAVLKSRKSS